MSDWVSQKVVRTTGTAHFTRWMPFLPQNQRCQSIQSRYITSLSFSDPSDRL